MSHGRELSSSFSYMDGVPVKIGEKYKPPRKITLPVAFQNRATFEISTEEYDFRLERSVLEKMVEWKTLRKTDADNRKERIKAHEDAWQKKMCEDVQKFSVRSTCDKNAPSENSGTSNMTHSNARVSSSVPSSLAYRESVPSGSISYTTAISSTENSNFSKIEVEVGPSQSLSTSSQQNLQFLSSILTPVPFSQNSSVTNSAKSLSHFNLSDFEADTSSPFDNMELKTINEMEELAHVLQPVSISPESNEGTGKSDIEITKNFSSTTPYNLNQNFLHYNTIGAKPTKDTMIFMHMNGLSGYNSFSTAPRTKEKAQKDVLYFNTIYNHLPNVSSEQTNVFSFYPHQAWNSSANIGNPSGYAAIGSSETQINLEANVSSGSDCLSGDRVVINDLELETELNSTVSFPSTHRQQSSEDQQVSGRSLSKSVPDIVQELEDELAVKRVAEKNAISNRLSHTPPPRPNSFSSAGLEDWKPWPDLDSPEPTHSKQKKSPGKLPVKTKELANPFHELPSSNQKLAKHISEMGFALPRVARACKMFGEDDKKVVEFLLQVQALEEKSWSGDLVEKALVINKHNISEAIRYLEAFTQLLDLGFAEDKVSEALLMFHNDRDKALDHLIS